MSELQPIGDRIIIEPFDTEAVTQGGIVLPQSTVVKEVTQKAKVVAVGAGLILSTGVRVEPEVKVGDIIVFNRMAGVEIKVDQKPYKILTERDIIGILRG